MDHAFICLEIIFQTVKKQNDHEELISEVVTAILLVGIVFVAFVVRIHK